MASKSLKNKGDGVASTATGGGLRPADFPLGSMESRAAARAIVHRLAEKDRPQPGDIWIDLTSLTRERATEFCRVLRALREDGARRGWDSMPQEPDSPRMWFKWPNGFDPDAAYKSNPPLTIDEVTDDNLTNFLRIYGDSFRKAKDDGAPLPPHLDPDRCSPAAAMRKKPINLDATKLL